jgi:hypothetical protein
VHLRVRGEHAGVQLHVHQADVLDVDDRIEPGLRRRRPVLDGRVFDGTGGLCAPPVGRVRRRLAPLAPPVDSQLPHGVHPHGAPAAQVVDHVNVVRAFLQQEGSRVSPVGVPILEVEVPPVADKVADEDGLHLADSAALDQLTHFLHERHVPHVVPDVQLAAPPRRRREYSVASLCRDRERLLEVHRLPRLERSHRLALVAKVRRANEHGVDPLARKQFRHVAREQRRLGPVHNVSPTLPRKLVRIHVAASDDARAGAGLVRETRERAAATDADHADAKVGPAGTTFATTFAAAANAGQRRRVHPVDAGTPMQSIPPWGKRGRPPVRRRRRAVRQWFVCRRRRDVTIFGPLRCPLVIVRLARLHMPRSSQRIRRGGSTTVGSRPRARKANGASSLHIHWHVHHLQAYTGHAGTAVRAPRGSPEDAELAQECAGPEAPPPSRPGGRIWREAGSPPGRTSRVRAPGGGAFPAAGGGPRLLGCAQRCVRRGALRVRAAAPQRHRSAARVYWTGGTAAVGGRWRAGYTTRQAIPSCTNPLGYLSARCRAASTRSLHSTRPARGRGHRGEVTHETWAHRQHGKYMYRARRVACAPRARSPKLSKLHKM